LIHERDRPYALCVFCVLCPAEADRIEERNAAAIFHQELELGRGGRPKRAAAGVSLALQDREEHKAALKAIADARAAASKKRHAYADGVDVDESDESMQLSASSAFVSASSSSSSSSVSSSSASASKKATLTKATAVSNLKQPTLTSFSFSAHSIVNAGTSTTAHPSITSSLSVSGSAGSAPTLFAHSLSSASSSSSSSSRSSSSSSSSSSLVSGSVGVGVVVRTGVDGMDFVEFEPATAASAAAAAAAASVKPPSYDDEQARFAALTKMKETEEMEAQAEIDPEIQAAADEQQNFLLASTRHEELVYKPWLEALLFGLGNRFPDSEVMVALQHVFDPTTYPASRDLFCADSYLLADVEVLATHFSQKSTVEGNQPAVDRTLLLSELSVAKVWLWEAWEQMLRDRLKIESGKAKDIDTSGSASKFFNPILRAANAVLLNIEPLAAPVVESNMFDLVCQFVQYQTVNEYTPHFLLLAKIAVTITVSTASCERGFSLMKLLLTRLRNRMSQEMLDALMRINLLGGALLTSKEIRDVVNLWHMATKRRV
jgi:hypothetical protein